MEVAAALEAARAEAAGGGGGDAGTGQSFFTCPGGGLCAFAIAVGLLPLHLFLSLPCATPAAIGMATRASTISGTRILVS
ncbi:MAG: hypothetical protein AUI08_09235 [Gemmatimonadetes bacterium 13_2_20CM_2_65_7]|nr:MAG: hypothetical protein AUI08_09235 [Gemmatimonadetes bacterium 13_2_20CM_2_65_7]